MSRTRAVALLLATSVLALLAPPARAEETPPIAIVHARVYVPGDHPPLEDATVILSAGKVLAVGAGLPVPPNARTLDARGKVVTPGFIDVGTDVGAVEIDLEAASNDTDARSAMTPALRMIDGYNPRSAVIPITRACGVTSAVVVPARGLLGGQSAFVDLTGDTVAEALVRPSLAQNAQVDETTAQAVAGSRGGLWLMLREALDDARFFQAHRAQYDANGVRPLSLRRAGLESLVPVVRGEQPLVVWAERASDIEATLRLADELKLKVVIAGGGEAWMMADEIARRKVPVIIDPLEDLPSRFDRLHARSDNAALLAQAGVHVVLSTFASHQARLLWQRAGNAVRLGMDHEAAIRAVTEAPADAFGLKGYGRLEKGAVANVVVWSGDPLQTGTRVEHVFIRGKEESLETRQSLLLQRYRTLPFVHDGSR
ncbi:MAG TPA: amidohydrolase family protein [Polyangiaceae bacterium]|jgi:imidazolonepropionase-like amidohydrolase